MRKISRDLLLLTLKEKLIETNIILNKHVKSRIESALEVESSELGCEILTSILSNATVAKETKKPLCQDTGSVVIFMEIGRDIHLDFDVYEAINEAVRQGYEKGYLRKSIVAHPIERVNTKDNTPAIIHTKIVNGDKLKLKVATKGGGAENMSRVAMLKPSDGYQGVVDFAIETVLLAKGNPCPPIILGIGIGGNFESAPLIAKEALLRNLDDNALHEIDQKLENEILEKVNNLGIGPMGLGGNTTCLAVKVNSLPCHIASFPVAVNIQCHSAREFEVTL
jgi:fumarate hydratase subunit alpha